MNRKTTTMLRAAIAAAALATVAVAQIETRMPAPGEAPPGSPVAKYGYLTATGGKLRGSKTGTTDIQLKGMSFHWSNGGDGGRQMYNENVVAWLAHDWEVDLLRAALAPSADGTNKGYCDGDGPGQESIVRLVIEESIKRGVYVLIDWHSHEAENERSCAEGFFQKMVADYGKYPNVIYEIYNEPVHQSWSTVQSYANSVISVIRSAETSAGVTHNNLIVVGSPQWSSQPNAGTVTDSKNNVAYTLHFYAGTGAHDGYRNNATSAMSSGRTVFATEWGTCDASGNGGYNAGNTDTWVNWMATNKISWANWAIANKNETASILNSGKGVGGNWADADLTESGKKVRGYFPKGNRTYAITLEQPSAGGTITKNPNNNSYSYGAAVTITNTPEAGWEFVNWTGDAKGYNATLNATVKGVPLTIGAVFYNGGAIKNGHFTNNTNSWTGSSATIAHDNDQLKVTPSAGGRVMQSSVPLTASTKYKLTFKARGQSARPITVSIGPSSATADPYMPPQTFQLTTAMQEFSGAEFDFTGATSISNAVLRIEAGDNTTVFFIDDVRLQAMGPATSVAPQFAAVSRATWSLSRTSGALTLRGPAEQGARVMVYDTRGKTVKSIAARDGLTLGKNLPAGNYLVVVKNAAGKEVLRTKALFAK